MTAQTAFWAIANVRTSRESEVASLLAQRGREVYFPQFTRWKQRRFRRRLQPVECPVMPGYLFIQHDTIGDPEELRSMENFHYLLLAPLTGKLELLPDSDIDWMRSNMEGSEKPSARPLRLFKLFDRVKVPDGPFGGLRGVVTAVMKQSVWVKLEGLNAPVRFPVLLLQEDSV